MSSLKSFNNKICEMKQQLITINQLSDKIKKLSI
jgi:hypothetical protein